VLCFLRGTDWIIKYYLDEFQLQRVNPCVYMIYCAVPSDRSSVADRFYCSLAPCRQATALTWTRWRSVHNPRSPVLAVDHAGTWSPTGRCPRDRGQSSVAGDVPSMRTRSVIVRRGLQHTHNGINCYSYSWRYIGFERIWGKKRSKQTKLVQKIPAYSWRFMQRSLHVNILNVNDLYTYYPCSWNRNTQKFSVLLV
jgi:hypothetical protein